MGRAKSFALNSRLAVVSAAGGTVRSVSDAFDENPAFVAWRPDGIYFQGSQGTAVHLYRVDPATGRVARLTGPDAFMGGGFSVARNGRVAMLVSSPTALPEVAVAEPGVRLAPRVLTAMSEQARALTLGTREIVRWKSRDGTPIEGVLVKPAGWTPNDRPRPLLVVIHGGPTGVDRPSLLAPDVRNYPVDVWAGRGALVLKVNYPAARATARSSARSTCATWASATRGTC